MTLLNVRMQEKFGNLWEEEEDSNDLSDYGSPQYWDDRYKESEKPFDWYFGWKRLSKEIKGQYSASDNVLVLGCGNSEMSDDMLVEGFPRIVSIDISPSVIVQMKEKYAGKKQLEWMEMDCTKMDAFKDGEFDLVIDKGTIDAIMCGLNSGPLVDKTMGEVFRVLKKHGRLIVITFGSPSQRLPVMRQTKRGWYVHPPKILDPEEDRPTEKGTKNYIYVFEKRE